tara:strand:- start:977 stop:1870 length:894 start_codon:yes stop_codon:yes gene_type:complete
MIVVTGASGLLGSNISRTIALSSSEIVGIYNNNFIESKDFESIAIDLSDFTKTNELIRQLNPSHIIHCAALTDVDQCELEPQRAWSINADASKNLSMLADDVGCGFTYVSTDSVFDGNLGQYDEHDIPCPINNYARSKLAGERMVIQAYSKALIIRTNFFGTNHQIIPSTGLANWVLTKLNARQAINGFRDVLFSPIFVEDLSELIINMIDVGVSGIYHVSGATQLSKYDFAVRLALKFGLPENLISPTSIDDSELAAPRPKNTTLSNNKIQEVLGKTMPELDAGLNRFKVSVSLQP